ncbi:MAG: MltA domain-containing protein [Pseudomonadota bacterium]
MGYQAKHIPFEALNGWAADDHQQALQAFAALSGARKQTPTTRALGIDGAALRDLAKAASALAGCDTQTAKAFFETHFQPVVYTDTSKSTDNDSVYRGFLTGYFEPVVRASRTKTDDFPEPIYRRPPDLIDLTEDNRPATLPADMRFGRRMPDGSIGLYHDRDAINAGALEGGGLELFYVQDRVTGFFIHVQGGAKLVFEDGSTQRITFAAKAGHDYTSLGAVLCRLLDKDPATMTADFLADWMRSNPDRLDWFLAHNRSYIFFEEENQSAADEGHVAAAKLPLIAGRSLAVDRRLHTFGTPIFVETKEPLPRQDERFQRLMVAHDTGSIIQGVQRGDYFAGSGEDAGWIAGRMRHPCAMTVLKPRIAGTTAGG